MKEHCFWGNAADFFFIMSHTCARLDTCVSTQIHTCARLHTCVYLAAPASPSPWLLHTITIENGAPPGEDGTSQKPVMKLNSVHFKATTMCMFSYLATTERNHVVETPNLICFCKNWAHVNNNVYHIEYVEEHFKNLFYRKCFPSFLPRGHAPAQSTARLYRVPAG